MKLLLRIIAALAVLALAPAAGVSAAAEPRTTALAAVGPELRVNQEPEAVRQHFDHTVTVNPTDPDNYVIISSNRVDRECWLHKSFDAGGTWESRPLALPEGVEECGIPAVAFARDGTLYVSYTGLVPVEGGDPQRQLLLARSADGGRSFERNESLGVAAVFSTGVAVDNSGGPRDGTVYLAYIPTSRPPNRRATVISSSDGGQTFSPPVTVAPNTKQVTGRLQIDVGSAGEVYVAYQDFTESFGVTAAIVLGADRTSAAPNDSPRDVPFTARVARSTDGFQTFTETEVDANLGGGLVADGQSVLPFPVVAADPTDPERAYVVVTDRRRDGNWDAYFYRTDDGGQTWSAPRRLNDDPEDSPAHQVMPWIDVAPGGRIDVVWLDRREDAGNRFAKPYGTSSYDGGETWTSNRALSATAFDATIGSPGQGPTSYLGDRLAVHSTDDGGVVVWPDTRNGNADNGSHDLFARQLGAPATKRVAGADRIATAIAASREAFGPRAAAAVVLARADVFADALAGAPLAAARTAPVLLTPPDALEPRTEAELQRVLDGEGTVFLLGGEAALSPAVERRVGELGYDVVRLAGPNRYATAVAIAQEGGDVGRILLASGSDFPDALTAGAAGAEAGAALVLTDGARMPVETAEYLAERPDAERFAVGGPAATAARDATRVAGTTRFETAVAVAETFFGAPSVVGIATARDFPDALSGGAQVGRHGGPILLSDPARLPASVADYLESTRATVDNAFVYGGRAVLSDDVLRQVTDAVAER
jgi:CBS domain-containing protein